MEKNYIKRVFFRDDDVYQLDKNIKEFVEIFIMNAIPITLSIIPEKLTKKCVSYLLDIMRKNSNIIHIGQHGLSHRNYSENNHIKYEFGPKRDYKTQEADIEKGGEILKEVFRTDITTFIPPWNGFDIHTLKILKKIGIPILSTDINHSIHGKKYGLKNICTTAYFNRKSSKGIWFTETPNILWEKIALSTRPVVGLEMHHRNFKYKKDFDKLSNLIDRLKVRRNIQFIPLSEAGQYSHHNYTVNPEALMYYLTYQFVPKPLTLFKDRINPVHKKYDFSYLYKNPLPLSRKDESTIAKKLHACLKGAVKNLLPRDNKPIGLLISGGIDSSAILHILREITKRKIYTITGAFHKKAHNLILAKRLANEYNTVHKDLIINPHALSTLKEIYSKNIPQPIGDNGLLLTYLLLKKLKENVDTVISGDGADCLFSGLKMHYLNFIAKSKGMIESTRYEHYQFGEIFLTPKELKLFFGNKFSDIASNMPLNELADKVSINDTLKRQVLIDLNFLVKNRIDYLIYSSQACKIKLLLPYLEKTFVDFAVKIPGKFLIKDSLQKYILKKIFEDKLPPEVVNRKKEPSSPPFSLWYETNKEFIIETLIKSIRFGIPEDYIKYLIRSIPKSSTYRRGMQIWLILNLVCWHEGINA